MFDAVSGTKVWAALPPAATISTLPSSVPRRASLSSASFGSWMQRASGGPFLRPGRTGGQGRVPGGR